MSFRDPQPLPAPEPEPIAPSAGWRHPVAVPYVAPEAARQVQAAIEAGRLSSATRVVQELEAALTALFAVPTAVACSNGWAALVLALRGLGIGPGDDVLVPAFTMVAVANAVLAAGANPVLVDCAEGAYNPGAEELAAAATEATRAVIVTHTYGLPADLDEVVPLCRDAGWALVEDIAEAIGTTHRGRLVGTLGDLAAASLYANKLITAGDGGFVLARDAALEARLRSLVNHGFVAGRHFFHPEVSGNYKIAGLAAALVTPAVPHVPELMRRREALAARYRAGVAGLPGLTAMPPSAFGPDAPWVFGIEVEDPGRRHGLRQALADAGIETRAYFHPLHLQPSLARPERPDCPNASRLGACGFYLPTHSALTPADQDEILGVLEAAGAG